MGSPFSCHCAERKKPVEDRQWFVSQYRFSTGAFHGYRATWSHYSTVNCLACGASGRTKASYVDTLPLGSRRVQVECRKKCGATLTLSYTELWAHKPCCVPCATLLAAEDLT